jgi:hypothetical protein
MKKMTTSFAVTAALLSSVATADTNPFGVTELSSGYMQLAEAEMACGANMKMDTPAPKVAEGACAGKKTDAKTAEAKKAAEEKAATEAAAKAKN